MRIKKVHVGLRTVKTAVAIIAAMVIVDQFGATSSRLIFAMLGAMSAVQPTFRDSVETCITQIVGVVLGALAGLLLLSFPIPALLHPGNALYRCGDGPDPLRSGPYLGYRYWPGRGDADQYAGIPLRQQPENPGHCGELG